MLTTEDGRFFYVLEEHAFGTSITSSVHIGNLTVSGDAVSGSEQAADFTMSPCQLHVSCPSGAVTAVSGTVSQRSTLVLDGYNWVYSSQYNNPSSLATTAGTWGSGLPSPNVSESSQSTLDIGSGGVLFDQDTTTNCVVTGQLSLISPSYNAYAVTLVYAGTDCASNLNGTTGGGIGYIDANGALNIGVNFQGAGAIVEATLNQFQPLGGIWNGVNLPAGTTAYMISDEGGRTFFRAANSSCIDMYETTMSIGGQDPDFVGDALGQMLPISCGGVVDNGIYLDLDPTSLVLTVQNYNTNVATPYNLSLNASAYQQSSSATAVSGSWTTPSGDTIVVNSSGAIAEADAASGCTVTGQISTTNPSYNVYYLTLHYSGCTSVPADLVAFTTDSVGLNGAEVTGLATIDNSMTPNQLDLWARIDFSDGSGSAIAYVVASGN